MKAYTKHDLLRHMVMVHRLGVCGFYRGGPGRRLKLPPPTEQEQLSPTCESGPGREVAGRKRRRIDHPQSKCLGCYKLFKKIEEHIKGSRTCRNKARYIHVVDGNETGSIMQVEVPEQLVRRRGGTHRCGLCRKIFVDIRKHLPRECPSKTFKVRDPVCSRDKWGPTHSIEDLM